MILALAAICFTTVDLTAQNRRDDDDQYFDESGSISHRLWYGTHFTLGFNGNGFTSLFQFGLAPMIGYKITDILSIGPRGSLLYYSYRINNGGGDVDKVNTTSWSVGAFTRVRVFQTFLAQVEYSLENDPLINSDLSVGRVERGAFYIGGGYNSGSGGPIAFEALLLYNVNQPGNTLESPLDYRLGITYNF